MRHVLTAAITLPVAERIAVILKGKPLPAEEG
jgi:hypothetical protein